MKVGPMKLSFMQVLTFTRDSKLQDLLRSLNVFTSAKNFYSGIITIL